MKMLIADVAVVAFGPGSGRHSEQLHVVERYTRDTPESIVYDVTIEAPVVFTKPWRQQDILHLRPGERIREYECIENNQDPQRIKKLLQNESIFRVPPK